MLVYRDQASRHSRKSQHELAPRDNQPERMRFICCGKIRRRAHWKHLDWLTVLLVIETRLAEDEVAHG